jgi:hypothetical protein
MAKKNTVNKKLGDVMSILERMGYNPIESLVCAAQNECLEWPIRMKAMVTIADKSVPTLKAIEHKNDEKQHEDMVRVLEGIMQPLLIEHKQPY